MKILVVDDSAFMRKIIMNVLQGGAYEFFEAGNTDEAVAKFKESSPDLIFLDIVMPGRNGVEALKEIKGMNSDANVVMCTSVGQDQVVKECVDAGAADFITKPFSPDEIKEVVARFTPE